MHAKTILKNQSLHTAGFFQMFIYKYPWLDKRLLLVVIAEKATWQPRLNGKAFAYIPYP